MKTIYEYICHGVRSLFRFYQHPYNKLWDEKLKWYLDGGEVLPRFGRYANGYCSTKVTKEGRTITVWIANKFFSYGSLYQDGLPEYRPSIKAMLLLNKRCQAYVDMVGATKLREDNKSYEDL